jgi:hypothetical protein
MPYNIEITEPKLIYFLKGDSGKSNGFRIFGFEENNQAELRQLLTGIAKKLDLTTGINAKHGVKFVQEEEITGLNGKKGLLRTVWQVNFGTQKMRCVTAIPMPYKD